jgi:hypothetical protein
MEDAIVNEHDPQALADALVRIARFDATARTPDDASAADDEAYRLLFAQTDDPVDSDRFVDRVMSATRGMPVAPVAAAPASRHSQVRWWKWAASVVLAATCVLWAVWLSVGGLGPVGVGAMAGAAIDMWSASVAVGVVLGRALTNLEVALGLALATGIGGGSVYGLIRMLSEKQEVSRWAERSSVA